MDVKYNGRRKRTYMLNKRHEFEKSVESNSLESTITYIDEYIRSSIGKDHDEIITSSS